MIPALHSRRCLQRQQAMTVHRPTRAATVDYVDEVCDRDALAFSWPAPTRRREDYVNRGKPAD
jgi:hypothetical protein